MVLPDYIRRAALGGGPTDLKMIKDWLESGGDINDVDADRAAEMRMGVQRSA